MASDNQSSKTMRIDIPAAAPSGRWPRHVTPAQAADGTRPRKTFGEIAVQNSDLSELFQNVYDSAFITELNGKIVDANVRATQSFLYSQAQFKQAAIMDIVLGMTEHVLATIGDNLRNDRFTLIQAECARQDGSLVPSEISTCKITLSGKTYLCFFIRDISARKEAEDALQAAHDTLEAEVRERTRINEELSQEIARRTRIEAELNLAIDQLQKHDRAKSQFVSNVSHELKTPLSSINYMAGNMVKGIAGPMTEQGKTYLSMIREDCQRLQRTVDDILDMSRIESNTLRLNLVRVNFGRFLRRTIESLRMQIEAQGLSLDLGVEGAGFAACDPQKMERVIFNVVKNAIKYNTAKGFIKIRLRSNEKESGQHVIEVIDSGIGIEAEHLPRITERFFRVGEYVSGAGLGLAICKDLMVRHGGMIEVTSPPAGFNKGTQVSLLMPVVPPPWALLAYEDDAVRDRVTVWLEEYGYRVSSGKLADGTWETALAGAKPDLVILEWIHAGMNGGIVISMLKGADALARVPVLAITDAEPAVAKREILEGFEIPRLLPSFNKEELWACVEEVVLGRKRLDV
jgi:PAS domain S-box-containing protein